VERGSDKTQQARGDSANFLLRGVEKVRAEWGTDLHAHTFRRCSPSPRPAVPARPCHNWPVRDGYLDGLLAPVD